MKYRKQNHMRIFNPIHREKDEKISLRACSHDPGTTHCPGQLTEPGVNFASVHRLTPVTVHMSFSLPRGNFERRVTRCPTPGSPPCRGNFSPCEQNAKVAPGQEQSCACSFLMFGINFPIKSSRKHQKQVNVFKIHSL